MAHYFSAGHMQKHPLGYTLGGLGAGTLLGGIAGMFGSGIGGDWLTGSKGKVRQAQQYTPEQQSALNQLLSMGMQNADISGLENRARQQFQTSTIPSIAERFTSMGGGQRSSAFQGALGQAGADLESQLAQLRGQFGMQQLGMGLRPQFENYYQPGQTGFLQQLLGILGGIGGM